MRKVLSNSAWNAAGLVFPLGVAVAAIPYLLNSYGVERFGVLSLVWVIVGYSSLFDLGVSRALTRSVAVTESIDERQAVASTGLAIVALLGIAGGIVVYLFGAVGIARSGLVAVLDERDTNLILVALSMVFPVILLTGGAIGILEGLQRFRPLNSIRAMAGVSLFLAPTIALMFSDRLGDAVAVIAVFRLLFFLLYVAFVARAVRLSLKWIDYGVARRLFAFGGWVGVSSGLAPVALYADRFVVGAGSAAPMLAYYAAPFDIVSKLLIIPASVCSASFPSLSVLHQTDRVAWTALFRRVLLLISGIVFPVAIVGAILTPYFLSIWLGPKFVIHGAVPMQILWCGIALNALSQPIVTALHSLGEARVVSVLQVLEIVPYLGAMTMLVGAFGIVGAATAWSLRALADLVLLGCLLRKALR